MFDVNEFKKKIKEWFEQNPNGEEKELIDYCENLIPSNQYAANKWLIDQTVSWYRHICSTRDKDFLD